MATLAKLGARPASDDARVSRLSDRQIGAKKAQIKRKAEFDPFPHQALAADLQLLPPLPRVETLVELLRDVLGESGQALPIESFAAHAPALLSQLASPSETLRFFVLQALGTLEPEMLAGIAKEAQACLDDDSSTVRFAALCLFGQMPASSLTAQSIVDSLVRRLRDDDVRALLLESGSEMGLARPFSLLDRSKLVTHVSSIVDCVLESPHPEQRGAAFALFDGALTEAASAAEHMERIASHVIATPPPTDFTGAQLTFQGSCVEMDSLYRMKAQRVEEDRARAKHWHMKEGALELLGRLASTSLSLLKTFHEQHLAAASLIQSICICADRYEQKQSIYSMYPKAILAVGDLRQTAKDVMIKCLQTCPPAFHMEVLSIEDRERWKEEALFGICTQMDAGEGGFENALVESGKDPSPEDQGGLIDLITALQTEEHSERVRGMAGWIVHSLSKPGGAAFHASQQSYLVAAAGREAGGPPTIQRRASSFQRQLSAQRAEASAAQGSDTAAHGSANSAAAQSSDSSSNKRAKLDEDPLSE